MSDNRFEIQPGTSMWETIATIMIVQSLGGKVAYCRDKDIWDLCCAADVYDEGAYRAVDGMDLRVFNYAEAYRAVDTGNTPYVNVLAQVGGCRVPSNRLGISGIQPATGEYIVICPFTMRRELELPIQAWQAVMKMLRMHSCPVYLLSGRGEWLDECGFSEDEILSERDIPAKLRMLAGAKLVVGVPNEWLWLTSCWSKKTLYYYPSGLPVQRWMWLSGDTYGRVVYEPRNMQLAALLAGTRMMIKELK